MAAVRKKFGEILVEAGALKEQTLQAALSKQRRSGKLLGEILEEHGLITERDIAVVLAKQFGLQIVRDISKHTFSQQILGLIDGDVALKKMIFPLRVAERKLSLAMVNPLDIKTLDELTFKTKLTVVPCVTTRSEIVAAVRQHYLGETLTSEFGDTWIVLVVDDQELIRSVSAAAMESEGYQVLQAANGTDGVKLALQKIPHLIISDTIMPRMDGYEMYRNLQRDPRTRKIPVIGLSSKCSPEEEARLLDMGYVDFISKPINAVRLRARVKRALKLVYGNSPPPRL